jgi:inorganic pyrophosphatase
MNANRKKDINDINDFIRVPPDLVQNYFSGYKIFNF